MAGSGAGGMRRNPVCAAAGLGGKKGRASAKGGNEKTGLRLYQRRDVSDGEPQNRKLADKR